MADRVGRERTKWCSGCHDPVVLFTGQMGKATQASFSYDSWEAQQGLTCMSCHSIAEIKDVKGNGAYVIEESKQYPFAFSDSSALRAVNRLLIRMEPSLHRKTFLKPFMRTPEFCSTCHKVGADSGPERLPVAARPEPLRHLVRLGRLGARGALLLRSAQAQGLPGLPPAGLPLERVRQQERLPARPRLPRREHGPALRARRQGDGEEDPRVPREQGADRRPLRDPARRRAPRPRRHAAAKSGRARRSTSRWSCAPAASVIRTRTGRRTPTRSGSRSRPRPTRASSSRAACSTRRAGSTRRRTAWPRSSSTKRAGTWTAASRRTSACRSTTTASGPARRASCTTASRSRRTRRARSRLSAGTHYRKFSRDYTTFTLGAASPSLPVTTLASDSVTLPVAQAQRPNQPPSPGEETGVRGPARGNADPPWLRWNDYGIGLFLQGDLKGAARAWTKVAELAPDKPDGPLNRARAEIAEGRLADAKASLAEAEKRRPGWGKTAFFRATVAKDEGRLADAETRSQGGPREVSARPRRLEQPRPRLLAGRKVPGSDRGLRQDARDRPRGRQRPLQPDAGLPRARRPEERRPGGRGVPQVQGGRVDPRHHGPLSARPRVGQPRVAAHPRACGGRPAARRAGVLGRRRSGRTATRPTAAI